MIGLGFDGPITEVLCLGAHADDIEIGALGLLRKLAAHHPDAEFSFVIVSGDEERRIEAEASMKSLVGDAGVLHMAEFEDGFLPYDKPDEVKRFVRDAISGTSPQLVIGPHEADRHQDHSFVSRLGQQLFRNHLILEYEIAKYDADLGRPQAFLQLHQDDVDAKLRHLGGHFESQHDKSWYDDESFRALLRLRGIECNSPSGYAEAFHVSKLQLQLGRGSR